MRENTDSRGEKCIWCGESTTLSETHIFPQSIGGFIHPFLACSSCNSFFGHSVENSIKRNMFFTAAIEQLGLASPKDAYSDVKKYDTKTEREVHLSDDGRASIVPGKVSDSHFIGDSANAKNFFVKKLRRERPNFSVKPLEQFFDDPKRQSFDYLDKSYKKDMTAEKCGTIRLDGMTLEPDSRLVFKIAYEILHLLELDRHTGVGAKLKSLFTVDINDSKERIRFSEQLKKSVTSNAFLFRNKQFKAEQIQYGSQHFVVLGLSVKGILYLEICFFNRVRTFFIIGRWDFTDQSIIPYLNLGLAFDISNAESCFGQFPNLNQPERVRWGNAKVETKFDGIVN